MAELSPERKAELHDQRMAIQQLRQNVAWIDLIEPFIANTARHHADQHENEALTAEKRAEHLHAMKSFRKLRDLLEQHGISITDKLSRRGGN